MPRLKYKLPKYSLHKATGQAVVTLRDRDYYLGTYGSPESLGAYRRIVAECSNLQVPQPANHSTSEEFRRDLRIAEFAVAYLDFAAGYYVKNGHPTGELANMKDALRPLQSLYDETPVANFGPASLVAVRERMITGGLSRKVVLLHTELEFFPVMDKYPGTQENPCERNGRTGPDRRRWPSCGST